MQFVTEEESNLLFLSESLNAQVSADFSSLGCLSAKTWSIEHQSLSADRFYGTHLLHGNNIARQRAHNILLCTARQKTHSLSRCLLLVMHHWAETRWKIKANQRNKMISLSLFRRALPVLPSGGSGAKKRDWLRAKLFPLWRVDRALNGATIALLITQACAAQFSETGPLQGEPL